VRPAGVSPALRKVTTGLVTEPTFRGNGWPPSDVLSKAIGDWINASPPTITQYLDRGWELPFSRLVLFSQIATVSDWNLTSERSNVTTILNNGNARTAPTELEELAELIDYRRDVLDEALAQRNNIIGWFAGILSFNPITHPWTSLIAAAAETYGLFLAMYWKAEFQRPRPSRLSPRLMPPIEVPGHLSFPSGHSTQAHLVARALNLVMPDAAARSLDTSSALRTRPDVQSPLFRMAERIARNREVLGLHYPSDSAAGAYLASQAIAKMTTAFNALKARIDIATGTALPSIDLVTLATAEWA